MACTTRNAKDGIYASGGRQSLVALRRSGGGYVGSKTLVLRS